MPIDLPLPAVEHGCPNDTYFTTAQVRPYIDTAGSLHFFDGTGSRRGWGAPRVRTTWEQASDHLLVFTVVGWHKHTVSPVGGTYYLIHGPKGWSFLTARARVVRDEQARIASLRADVVRREVGRGAVADFGDDPWRAAPAVALPTVTKKLLLLSEA